MTATTHPEDEPINDTGSRGDGLSQQERLKLIELAQAVFDQDQLNQILIQVPNRLMRREVYELLKPLLPFESRYPRWVNAYHKRSEY